MSILSKRGVTRFVLASTFVAICAPSSAQPYSTIRTPPLANLAPMSNEASLQQLVLANLIASNCKIPDLTSGDAALLAGTAQVIAEQLGVSTDQYFSAYVHPAMLKIVTESGCDQHADMAGAMVENLKALGGSILED